MKESYHKNKPASFNKVHPNFTTIKSILKMHPLVPQNALDNLLAKGVPYLLFRPLVNKYYMIKNCVPHKKFYIVVQ